MGCRPEGLPDNRPRSKHGHEEHFATEWVVAPEMVSIAEFRHALDLLDRVASPAIVDRALRASGLSRKALSGAVGYMPYRSEACVIEHVARSLGDRQLGARLGQRFDYDVYDAYARLVLGSPDLATALRHGKRAFPLIHPGSEIVLRERDGHVLVARRSGLRSVIGHQHLDDGAIFVIGRVMHHFLGPDWRPAWIELEGDGATRARYIEERTGASVRLGAEMPAIAVRRADLDAPNPMPPAPHQLVALAELPARLGLAPPKTTEDVVHHVLAAQMALGDLSEDGVARQLCMGPRTLQRKLQAEGTSFRQAKARFVEARARRLLAVKNLHIDAIARSLGYDEPKSFRRAFSNWTGLTPTAYRKTLKAK